MPTLKMTMKAIQEVYPPDSGCITPPRRRDILSRRHRRPPLPVCLPTSCGTRSGTRQASSRRRPPTASLAMSPILSFDRRVMCSGAYCPTASRIAAFGACWSPNITAECHSIKKLPFLFNSKASN